MCTNVYFNTNVKFKHKKEILAQKMYNVLIKYGFFYINYLHIG